MQTTAPLDQVDRQLLNEIQAAVPLESAPFAALAARLGTSETDVMGRIERLKRERIIRQIGAIFDTQRLGYRSSLVAARYATPAQLVAAARVISDHPGVSHNYERDHAFNLWYTLAVPPGIDLARTAARLHDLTGAEATRLLPTVRLFKIGVRLDVTGADDPVATVTAGARAEVAPPPLPRVLSAFEVECVRALQQDLPTVPAPFAALAETRSLTEQALLEAAHTLRAEGVMRRFAGVLRHRQAGFGANAMTVWNVEPDRIEAVGQQMASFKAVSHCYQRQTYPDWPYSLFAMLHGRSDLDCQATIAGIVAATRVTDYAVLYSRTEFKKVRLTYFDTAFEAWEREFATTVPT